MIDIVIEGEKINIKFHPKCVGYKGRIVKILCYLQFEFIVLYVPYILYPHISRTYEDFEKIFDESFCLRDKYSSRMYGGFLYKNEYRLHGLSEIMVPLFNDGNIRYNCLRYSKEEFLSRPTLIEPKFVGDYFKEELYYLVAYIRQSFSYFIDAEQRVRELHLEENRLLLKEQSEEKRIKEMRFKEKIMKFGALKKYAPENIRKLKNLKSFGLSENIKKSGVYFLCDNGFLNYIGQSINIRNRVYTHIRDGKKKFDSVYYITIEEISLSQIEKVLINKFAPPLNIVHNRPPLIRVS